MNTSGQIAYILTNPVLPSIVKIGGGTRPEIEYHLQQIKESGVSASFDCVCARRVGDAVEAEGALLFTHGATRANPCREFFCFNDACALETLYRLSDDDVTPAVNEIVKSFYSSADGGSARYFA